MLKMVLKVFISSFWPLCIPLVFLAVELSHNRFPSSSLIFVGLLILTLRCLWHFLSRGVLPIIEICCKHTTTYERAHVVSLYHRNNILFFPWRQHAEIKLSNEKTGLTWIGKLDESICKDSRVSITFCKKSRYILAIEAFEHAP